MLLHPKRNKENISIKYNVIIFVLSVINSRLNLLFSTGNTVYLKTFIMTNDVVEKVAAISDKLFQNYWILPISFIVNIPVTVVIRTDFQKQKMYSIFQAILSLIDNLKRDISQGCNIFYSYCIYDMKLFNKKRKKKSIFGSIVNGSIT